MRWDSHVCFACRHTTKCERSAATFQYSLISDEEIVAGSGKRCRIGKEFSISASNTAVNSRRSQNDWQLFRVFNCGLVLFHALFSLPKLVP